MHVSSRENESPHRRFCAAVTRTLLSCRVSEGARSRVMLKYLPAVLLLLAPPVLGAQVLVKHPFATEMARALELEAGATATDVPHHVHYDLKLYDRHHKLTTSTWDIWRNPLHYVRTDIVAGDFRYTHIEDLVRHRNWRHFDNLLPLKLYDLRQNYEQPAEAVALFSNRKLIPNPMVTFQQIEHSPFECTEEILSIRICFDPLAHMLAFAQIMNQTITWENWQPLGSHSVPGRSRIYDGDRLIVEASGKAEEVKTFRPDLFVIPKGEPDMGEPEEDDAIPHRIVTMKPIGLNMLYGNTLVDVFVDPAGKVKKIEVVDADDNDLIDDVKRFVHHLRFAPEMKDGVAVPFDEPMYIRHGADFDASPSAR